MQRKVIDLSITYIVLLHYLVKN